MIPQPPAYNFSPSFLQLTFSPFLSLPHAFLSLPLALPAFQIHTQKGFSTADGAPCGQEKAAQSSSNSQVSSGVEYLANGAESRGRGGQDLKKQFKKDRPCPVPKCSRKYSSRIALRAHMRKYHPGWYQDVSDYEP